MIHPRRTSLVVMMLYSVIASIAGGNFLAGVIDLVFRRRGRYFLLDFKSNVIDDGYGPGQLAASMADHRYDLQYRIYTVALLRWLRRFHGAAFDHDRHFVADLRRSGIEADETVNALSGRRR